MKRHRLILRSFLVFFAFYFVYGCAVNPVTGKKEISLMSEEKEIALGKQYDPSIVASFGKYDDAELQAFINEKGQEMAKISHRPHLQYEFKVLDSPVVNAFAVPGGYVYFTRGILAHFSNEAEFAGVLGHEIGHITAKHGVRQQTTQLLSQIGLIGGVILTKGQAAQELSQAIGLLNLRYSRDHESESDELGVDYSTQIGYDANEMANFFFTLNRMRENAGVNIPTFQSTHPDPLNRYENVKRMSTERQAELGLSNPTVGRDSYLRMIDGLMYGEDPQQGYVEDDYFFHPQMRFKFPVPRQWRTANSPQAFQMANEEGKAMMVLTLGQGSMQETINAFNEQQKLQVISSRSTSVNRYPALRQVAEQTNEQNGQKIRILSYLIEYNGNIYVIHGVAAAADYPTYERTFEYTMTNFAALNDPSKINRQADEIKIQQVNRTGTLQQVLQYYNMPNDRLEEIAVLNSMKLTDQIPSGMLIKTVVNNGQYQKSTVPSTTNQPNTDRTSTPSNTESNTNTNTTPNTNKIPSTTTRPDGPSNTNKIPSPTSRPSTTTTNSKNNKIPGSTNRPNTSTNNNGKKIDIIKKKNGN